MSFPNCAGVRVEECPKVVFLSFFNVFLNVYFVCVGILSAKHMCACQNRESKPLELELQMMIVSHHVGAGN